MLSRAGNVALAARWRAASRALLGASVIALALSASACGPEDSAPLTIADCQQLGGSPLFDPEDERPIEASCPPGLAFLGTFDEPFFGSEGGICCIDAERRSIE